jgi:hypothetical protein
MSEWLWNGYSCLVITDITFASHVTYNNNKSNENNKLLLLIFVWVFTIIYLIQNNIPRIYNIAAELLLQYIYRV